MFENVKRNPNRIRKVARRTAINPVDAMTPQAHAMYANENVSNAYANDGNYIIEVKKDE
tara:strand:- start:324 stop:500 length:177 start_codon:yes stop_codon:yes gene_type:complete